MPYGFHGSPWKDSDAQHPTDILFRLYPTTPHPANTALSSMWCWCESLRHLHICWHPIIRRNVLLQIFIIIPILSFIKSCSSTSYVA